MAEIDYVQILLGFLGGSGLVGVVVTYIQLREERKERARDRLIGLVMTSEMGRFLGSLGNHSNRLYDGLELARKLPETSALWKPEDYRTLAELGRWQKEMSQVRRTLITRFHTISDNGDFLLTPTQWRSKTVECFDCWGRFSECMRDMLTLHLPEKKRKTEKRGAQTLPTDEDLHDALRKAETALDEAESAAQALDFEVRKSLGLTILEE